MARADQERERPYVSRAGGKLEHALREFAIDVTGWRCADFGCNVGGFTDCLLQHGAARVNAIDTGYGTLAYSLRIDPRVVVMERVNALHADPPEEPMNLVTIDLGWTPQRHSIPAARRWLAPASGLIISLVKPHYELTEDERRTALIDGVLDPTTARGVLERVLDQMPALGVRALRHCLSPITGRKSARRSKGGGGNIEFLVLLAAE